MRKNSHPRQFRSPLPIFITRLRHYYASQWEVARTAVDWVVAIYFIIPALIAIAIIYISLWRNPPVWFNLLPFELIIILLYIYTLFFTLRSFLEAADQVFLLQNKAWISAIRRYGAMYSYLVDIPFTALLFIALSPLLAIRFGWSPTWIIVLFVYTLTWKWIIQPLFQCIRLQTKGWAMYASLASAFIGCGVLFTVGVNLLDDARTLAMGPAIAAIIVMIVGAAAFFVMRRRLRIAGTFLYEVDKERRARLRLSAFLLSQSGDREEKPWFGRQKPWMLHKSQRIVKRRDKQAALMEAIIKSFLRSPSQWIFCLQFIAASSASLLLTDGWWKLVVIAGLYLLLYKGIQSYCAMAAGMSYLDLFQWTGNERQLALRQAVLRLALPIAVLLLVIAILTW